MDNRFKLRISPIFRYSFASCRPRKLSDIIENPTFFPHQTIDPFLSKPRPFPSICRTEFPETIEPMNPLFPMNIDSGPNSSFRHEFSLKSEKTEETIKRKKKQSIKKTELHPFSDDSKSRRRKHSRRKGKQKDDRKMGFLPFEGKVEDSYVVVKSSSDPYSDFRTSMVEMIVEKQIYLAEDLEELLECFLSLNLEKIHFIIVEVFMEILDALFF